MSRGDADCLVFLVADVQQLHEPFRDSLTVNTVEYVCTARRIPAITQDLRRGAEVVGFEIVRQYPYKELMVHVLNDTIDGAGQLSGFVQRLQMPEMPSCLAAGQRVLDVLTDGSVDISACGLVIAEGSVLGVDVLIIEAKLSGTERTAVADILVDTVDAKQSAM